MTRRPAATRPVPAARIIDWDALYGEGGINEYEGEILDDLYYDVNKQLHESVIRFDDILQQTNIDSNLINSMTTLPVVAG